MQERKQSLENKIGKFLQKAQPAQIISKAAAIILRTTR